MVIPRSVSKPPAARFLAILAALLACLLVDCAGRTCAPAGSDLVGSERCATCHEREAQDWRYGGHRTVACERCHGPGADHARAEAAARPAMGLGDVALCVACHRTIGSFEDHLRSLEREHRITLDREKSGTDCVYCHDPHLLE